MENVFEAIINEMDNLFEELTSDADTADAVHAIPAFRLLQLGY